MSANEARAEAERRWPQWRRLRDSWDAVAMRAAFRQGARWQAYRKVEVAANEREALLQTLRNYGQRPATVEGIRKGGDAELTDFLIAAGYRCTGEPETESHHSPQRAETAMTTGTPERG